MRTYQRGFFCSDLSIRYPYHECTITVPMLLVCMLLLPMLFLGVVEIIRLCHNFRWRQYLRNACFSLACFSFGFIATYLSTELAKNVVRRLRPHFYMACRPQLNDGSTCDDPKNRNLFVELYYCSNRDLSARQLRELYVSFPSAHSSLSFYAMLFLAFYLHAIWRGGRGVNRVLRHLLQFLFLSLAWFISLSRVADYWHHWSDVMAGAIMGVIYATLTAVYVGRFLSCQSAATSSSALGLHAKQSCLHQASHKLKTSLKQPMQHVAATVSFQPSSLMSHDSPQHQLQQQQQQRTHHQLHHQQQMQTQRQLLQQQHQQQQPQAYSDQTSSTTSTTASTAAVLEAVTATAPSLVEEELVTLTSVKEHLIASNERIWKSGT
ncbi:putative phosphatidate phosphatase [Stomoxys calcitrans]|uniref:putative phosphatidate phosphatase n=1 Tax=Stomoxys calcitrans TaxID=35570 RepID=UPI0027E326D9|nr:putative phosphatidate phosphatase [Stomoxys calcitrans]XP_059216320.1 putative phosphatidate phosphatase [Stomoxys calcitrans]XP_059216321.1 putative phosphatidate phosphatase [Stomoxys calcitrans]XP_059216322.1 putative phosphatidate phosphatase [Stomoxys calcitrans]XP_059216323.1 putative phosphatidate phosphatase [Stomoxys calcitrans]